MSFSIRETAATSSSEPTGTLIANWDSKSNRQTRWTICLGSPLISTFPRKLNSKHASWWKTRPAKTTPAGRIQPRWPPLRSMLLDYSSTKKLRKVLSAMLLISRKLPSAIGTRNSSSSMKGQSHLPSMGHIDRCIFVGNVISKHLSENNIGARTKTNG